MWKLSTITRKDNMNTANSIYVPPVVYHPGEILSDKLDELNMSVKEFALRSGKPEKTVHAVLKGESGITPDMAIQFEKVLQIPAHFWLNAQKNYDEAQARKKRNREAESSIAWMKNFPFSDMVKKGFLPQTKGLKEKAEALLSFFGFAKASAWDNYYENQNLATVFRMSLKGHPDRYALSAWLRYGEIEARKRTVPSFSKSVLQTKIAEMQKLANSQLEDEDFKTPLADLCAEAGVILVYTPHLTKTKANGATRCFCDHPLVQVSDCHKRYDIFWFSFFHELGHVMLHNSKKDIFLEGDSYSQRDQQKEEEADRFAGETLLPSKLEAELKGKSYSATAVLEFAAKHNIHPAFIVGRMHHLKEWHPSLGHEFIPRINF